MSLFYGPAVVIDDNIAPGNADQINDLISEIKAKSIPYATYGELPNADELVKHLDGVSFLILDWDLRPQEVGAAEEGVHMPDTWSDQNIDFLRSIMAKVFLPIFIFTSSDIAAIQSKLQTAGLYDPAGNNRIFVERKSELVGGHLFEKIEEWAKSTSAVYVLKEWEKEYKKAKSGLFLDFYGLNHAWPKVLWKTYTADGNPNMGLGDMITRNLYTRMSPFQFDEAIINRSPGPDPAMEELRKVLEGERFLSQSKLAKNDIAPGDFFTIPSTEKFYLNIRATCDTARHKNPDLYLIKGKVLNVSNPETYKNGEFIEKHTNAIVACIHDGKVIEFSFRELEIQRWNTIKNNRVGRLLPPYITRIQQKYALFQHRAGTPPIPEEAFYPIVASPAATTQEDPGGT